MRINDAQDVSAALQRLGFETIVGLDLDDFGMKEKCIAFARAAIDGGVALVYYSGHGHAVRRHQLSENRLVLRAAAGCCRQTGKSLRSRMLVAQNDNIAR
jgi:uncharacterized caspase-like protein